MHKELHSRWLEVLHFQGSRTACVDAESERTLSFEELDRQAELLINSEPLNLHPGAVWYVRCSDRVRWLVTFLAAIKSGVLFIPLDDLTEAGKEVARRRWGHGVLIDDKSIEIQNDAQAACEDGARFVFLKATSGTTGEPKLLPFSETELLADATNVVSAMQMRQSDCNFAILPLSHSYALGNLVLTLFVFGIPIVLGSAPFPAIMAQEMIEYRCTVASLVPPLIRCISREEWKRLSQSSLRLLISAGSPLANIPEALFDRSTDLTLINFYGSSETGGIASAYLTKDSSLERSSSNSGVSCTCQAGKLR